MCSDSGCLSEKEPTGHSDGLDGRLKRRKASSV
jgi:hypothetical protein